VVNCAAFDAEPHMDMYHPDVEETQAPEGFTIEPAG
jgi:hypothetical protein